MTTKQIIQHHQFELGKALSASAEIWDGKRQAEADESRKLTGEICLHHGTIAGILYALQQTMPSETFTALMVECEILAEDVEMFLGTARGTPPGLF